MNHSLNHLIVSSFTEERETSLSSHQLLLTDTLTVV